MSLFALDRCALVGMVHLGPLPGSPRWRAGSMREIISNALRDADALMAGGCDALLVENMGDLPYLRGTVHPETTAAAAVAVAALAQRAVPIGIQLLAGANREALGVAIATGADFIRVEGFAYAHVADEGWLDACAGELTRARAALQSSVAIWADVQKKHAAHAVTSDIPLAGLAHGAAFCGADALVVTGASTGHTTALEDVEAVRSAGLPVVVGSGVHPGDAPVLSEHADALIVGSYLKVDGDWRNRVDVERVRAVRSAMHD